MAAEVTHRSNWRRRGRIAGGCIGLLATFLAIPLFPSLHEVCTTIVTTPPSGLRYCQVTNHWLLVASAVALGLWFLASLVLAVPGFFGDGDAPPPHT